MAGIWGLIKDRHLNPISHLFRELESWSYFEKFVVFVLTTRNIASCRDIKPANILLSDDGSAILMDLGSMDVAVHDIKSAQEGQKLQDDAAERCTMPYRAPELFNVQTRDKITQATDIWVGFFPYFLPDSGTWQSY